MASEVEICNLALALIGVSQSIASRSEGSSESRACDRWFDACRDQLLRGYDWPFAGRYVTLGLVGTDPTTDWGYSYRYPSDALKVRRIVGSTRTDPTRFPFRIGSDSTARLIYTDQADAVAEYTVAITDPELFDALFTDALVGRLGARIAPSLSRSEKDILRAQQYEQIALGAAFAEAANEGVGDPAPDAESIQARD